MRCVFDTNVLISAALVRKSKPREALQFALEAGTVLLSSAVLAEVYEVLRREKFRRYASEETIREFVAALADRAERIGINPDLQIRACRDPKDDKFLELAIEGRATHLISGDSDLLALHPFRGVQILSPQQFLLQAHRS